MARRVSNTKSRAVDFFINGKRSNDQYGLADFVGRTIKRVDRVNKLAAASTARKMVSIAREEIVKIYAIKKSALNKRMFVERTPQTLFLKASMRLIPAMRFDTKWAGPQSAGASVQIIRGKTIKADHAFINRSGKSRYEALRIRPISPNGKRVGRGPLDMIYGPSVHDMLHGKEMLPQSQKRLEYLFTPRDIGPYAPRRKTLARAAEYHVAEVRRLLESEKKNG